MKGWVKIIFVIWFLVIAFDGVAFAQEDRKGCKDHPMFTRMENFYIYECRVSDYDQADFRDEKGKTVKVEGKYYYALFKIKKGVTPPSALKVIRNFQNAIKNIGGKVIYENIPYGDYGYTYMTLFKPEMKSWIILEFWGGDRYKLIIVEKAEMAQEVVADAKSMMSDIQTKGSASVYGIYFDFDKADIKPESEPAIKEIAKLLQENRTLKLYVVGHTDNVGTIDYNLKLSKARADAVVKELTTKYKISPDRLRAFGVASLAPVASNKTEDGRAKNRRVELVEQ
ncbi:MAG: OmpA family protein [Thermodesulfovibrio sp.]|nr:OmpA family protein [Thermodesulfovibrio sp.]